MKTIKASLLLPLLTILILSAFSGCYTRFAIEEDDQYSTAESTPIIIYEPVIIPVYVPEPIYNPPSTPIYNPLPSAGSSQIGTVQQSPQGIRDSGYRRSGESENRQTTNLGSQERANRPTQSR